MNSTQNRDLVGINIHDVADSAVRESTLRYLARGAKEFFFVESYGKEN